MAKTGKKTKSKAGRPKNKYTNSQIKKIKDLASLGCQTRTIAIITGIAENTLRDNFRGLLELHRDKKRQEFREEIDTKKGLNFGGLLDKKEETLRRNFGGVLELHRAKRKANLRASQTRLATTH